MAYYYDLFFMVSVFAVTACGSNEKNVTAATYDGPIRFIANENTLMTDSGRTMLKIKSNKRLDFKNGDQEWPEGLSLEIFKKDGSLKSTFTADFVSYDKQAEVYKGTGNVIVINHESDDELNTEELFWDPNEETFYTEKFVTITSEEEVHTGQGLKANQSFETYTILKPSGTLMLDRQDL